MPEINQWKKKTSAERENNYEILSHPEIKLAGIGVKDT
jgi:hypothetical protein